jgi:xylan 1,4-beta-xylosidase
MKKILFIIFVSLVSSAFAQTWINPVAIPGQITPGGIGDPYVMKYRGTYYLYSSNDEELILRCWSSKDLINWTEAVTCSIDPVIKGAYAPEVKYWNGVFYMVTSPYGNGHYVLSSTSPTGPFKAVTGNLGKVIDGDVFINDDGSWYFYHADGSGILGCAMPNPTSIGADVNLGVQMTGQWTEGPSVIKRNGIYYLLYTGNHVLTPGYRTNYAKSTLSPISGFSPQSAQNPILISSEGSFVGLGHGTAFIGPDLDTYFFDYHNLVSSVGGSPVRKFNYDRMAWNGDKLLILGPTNWIQQDPKPADMSDFFNRTDIGSDWTMPNGGNWAILNQDYMAQDSSKEAIETWHKALNNNQTGSNYTAEFTLKEESRSNNAAKLGAVFGYTDESNYGIAVLHSFTNQLEINFSINGVWGTAQLFNLPAGFNCNVWHSIRIEKSQAAYKFFVDGLLRASLTSSVGGGKVGYMTSWSQGDFGYIAFSNKVNGSGIFDIYKPVPGTIEAVHYNNGGEGVGYHDLTPGNSGGQYIRNDSVDISSNPAGGYHISDNQSGEWYKYNVNVDSTGTYNVGIRYAASSTNCQIKIWQGGTDVTGVVNLPATGGTAVYNTFTIPGLKLTSGYQTLKIEILTGGFNFYEMQFKPASNEIVTKTDHFDTTYSSDWNYSDGSWTIQSGQAAINGFGKKLMGNTGWTDYTVEADVKYVNSMNAGILFRVSNPSIGGADNDPGLGTDFLQGYFVGLGSTSVTLGKQNYGWTQLTSASGAYLLNTTYHIKIVTLGANIKIYVTDMTTPKINYTDPNPFINGKVGLRSCNVSVLFDNFTVTTGDEGNVPQSVTNVKSAGIVELFPNPATNQISIKNTADFTELEIYTVNGLKVYKTNLSQPDWTMNISPFNNGLYLVKMSNNSGLLFTGKFVKQDI